MKTTCQDELAGALHEMAVGIHAAGLMPKSTLREIESLCLTPIEQLTPEQIRSLREATHASQAVFARHLNVSTGVVSQWERGEKKPGGACLKLLNLVKQKGLAGIA